VQEPLWAALILTTLAGLSIPIGAALALCRFGLLSEFAASEARHGIVAFGAGALLAAVALVLIPEGAARLQPVPALIWFVLGALIFALIDRVLANSGSKAAQFLAMMMDYLPEAMALGALVIGDFEAALLVALLIGLQNLPEGFNAMEEMRSSSKRNPLILLLLFGLMVPLGPVAAYVGFMIGPASVLIGAIMMLASGGILYLMFQDIAPQIPLENAWLPPFGAVLGFLLGLAGDLLI
jgi:ZIP family zinc transporter